LPDRVSVCNRRGAGGVGGEIGRLDGAMKDVPAYRRWLRGR
jgi:hypothetical protein